MFECSRGFAQKAKKMSQGKVIISVELASPPSGGLSKQEQRPRQFESARPTPAGDTKITDELEISIPTTTSGSQKFLSLEGLRGILALLVCLGHLGLNTMTNKIGVTVRFGLAVDVFFALSGFVLCYSNYFGRRTFKRFAVGRIARLYPMHVLTFVAMTVIFMALQKPVNDWQVVQQAFLVHNIGLWPNDLPPNFPNWSISVEFWVSILFYAVLRDRRLRLPLLLVIAGMPVLFVTNYIYGDAQNAFSVVNLGLLRGIAGFAVGAAAYLVFEKIGNKAVLPATIVYLLLAALGFFFLLEHWSTTTVVLFYAVLLTNLVLLAANDQATLLSSRAFVLLGAISYSIYLSHIPILSVFSLAFGDDLVRGVAKPFLVLVVLAVSYLSYKWIERPSQRLILDWFGRFRENTSKKATGLL